MIRSIDSGFWEHPLWRRHPWYVRDLMAILFSKCADDEGRFRADPLDLLEEGFPRNYGLTEDDIAGALDVLEEAGMIARYGEHGVLVGFYEHQYINAANRAQSALPAPPDGLVEVASWEEADGIKDAFLAAHPERKARGLHMRDALRWARQQRVNGANTDRVPRVDSESTPSRRDRIGTEGNGRENTPTREADPLEEPERPTAGGDGKGQRPDDGKARMEACSPDWASIFERFGDDPVNGGAQQNIRLALAGKCVDSGNRERCGATSPGDMRRKLIAVLQVMDWGWTDPPVILARRAVDTAADWHDRDLRAAGPSPPGLPALEDIQPLIAQPKGDRDNGKQQQA